MKTEWEALRKSGLHHFSVRQGRRATGRKGVARVLASIIVAMPYVIDDLEQVTAQQIVEVPLLANSARHQTTPAKHYRRGSAD